MPLCRLSNHAQACLDLQPSERASDLAERGDGTFSSQVCSVSWAHHHSACISYQWLTSLTPGSQRLEKLRMLDSQFEVVILLCISPGTIPVEPGAGESLRAEFQGGTGLPFSLHVASHPLGDGDRTHSRMAEGSETRREPRSQRPGL